MQLGSVPEDIARVEVGAAIERATFGDLGPLSVTVDSGTPPSPPRSLDAATSERSMIVAEVYRRRDVGGCGFGQGIRRRSRRVRRPARCRSRRLTPGVEVDG